MFFTLTAWGIGKGAKVIIPAFTFKASIMAVVLTGATPLLAEVESDSCNIDVRKLNNYIVSGVKVIMPVHIYGNPADMDRILEFANIHNILVLEDACEAQGALYKNKKTGSFGRASAFSFYPSKNLGGYGDGGAVITNDDNLAEKIRALRSYGSKNLFGFNNRLATIQAAVLRTKLPFLDLWNDRRREIAKRYIDHLKDLPIELPIEKDFARHVYYLFVIKVSDRYNRDRLRKFLINKGIEARIHFESSDIGKKGDFPVAEKIADTVLSLPMHPFLFDEEIKYITDSIHSYFS